MASIKEINLCPRISLQNDLHKATLLHPRHTVFHSSFCSSVFICIFLFFCRPCEFCTIGERNTEVYTLCVGIGCSSTNKYSATNCRNVFLAHLSQRLIGELIGYSWSGVRPSSVIVVRRRPSSVRRKQFQTSSSPKPLA